MSDNNQNQLAALLRARRAGLDALDAAWELIDDVVEQHIKYRAMDGWHSKYLPKGNLEPQSEYQRRIELTPFFPQTPLCIANRLGALFAKGLAVTNAAPLATFLPEAGRRHASFDDIAATAAQMVQMHGFVAALIDHETLPDDLIGQEISQADADKRRLGRPFIALYAAQSIYDWEYGPDGRLLFVKIVEEASFKSAWDAPTETETQVRIVDRTTITLYHITTDAQGNSTVVQDEPLSHGFNVVPVALCHPFPNPDGLGRPILLRIAESDISSMRILSDIVWSLFVLGTPLLTLTTNKTAEQLNTIAASATRYIPLDGGVPNQENPETLAYVQLDPTGIELQFQAHTLMMRQGLASNDGQGPEVAGGAAVPREQSGVAQAWRFKTGEERILFLLARSLEKFYVQILTLAAEALGTPCTPIVKLPESFDDNIPGRDPRSTL